MRPIGLGLIFAAGIAAANDHNNIDAGRPLRFEDAYSIAYRERVLEFGASWTGNPTRYGFDVEFKQGMALNQEWGIGFALPVGSSDGRHVELTYFHGLRREIDNAPALAYRLSAESNDEGHFRGRITGIATKSAGQFDKLHLNLTSEFGPDAEPSFSAILGYSAPVGYPRRFDLTFVAEAAYDWGDHSYWSVGAGFRQQIGPDSIMSFGITTELAEKARPSLRFGWSKSF